MRGVTHGLCGWPLTLVASRLDLSRAAGEVYAGDRLECNAARPHNRRIMPSRSESDSVRRLMLFFAVVYTVEGIGQAKVGIVWQPLTYFLKTQYGWTALQIAASLAVLDVPWVIKPLYGLISDFLPLFGYRRRSYLLLSNLAAIAAFAWVTQVVAPGADRVRAAADLHRHGGVQHVVRRAAGGERPAPQCQRRLRQPAMAVVQRRGGGDVAGGRRVDRDLRRQQARCTSRR